MMRELAALTTSLLLMPVLALWRGYVFTLLWAWFVVPQFGLAQISLPVAVGFWLIVSLMQRPSPSESDRDSWEVIIKGVAISIMAPAIALLFGAFFSLFVGAA